MNVWAYIPRLTEKYMDTWLGCGGGGGGGCPQSIPQLRVTEEYIPVYSSVRCNRGIYFIFLGTDEYSGIYSSALYSLVPSSINQGI
jgi:hypothetical protein